MKREAEAEDRYGGLLDNAKPDYKIYDDMVKVDTMCRNIRQQREAEYEQENRRRQERIERERREEQEWKDKHDTFINDCLSKKEAKREAIEKKKKEEAEKADFYKRVERLANIDPHMAEVYIQKVNHK